MEIVFITCGIGSLICGLYLIYMGSKLDYTLDSIIGWLAIGMAIFYFILASIHTSQPTALDVYRGRTTLEITYKDSVAIDSVVVFKKN